MVVASAIALERTWLRFHHLEQADAAIGILHHEHWPHCALRLAVGMKQRHHARQQALHSDHKLRQRQKGEVL